MMVIHLPYTRALPRTPKEPLCDILVNSREILRFNPSMLGLGDLNRPAQLMNVLAAVFDLEGFTAFSAQSDPHLSVPSFMDKFVYWVFTSIRKLSIERQKANKLYLFCPLPFFSKFMGDGVLYLWRIDDSALHSFCRKHRRDARSEALGDIGNIVSVLYDVCRKYRRELYPRLAKAFVKVPARLRCGIAQGLVCSVGNGHDFVGPCINIASRLQKLGPLGFCILQKGFEIDVHPATKLKTLFMCKKAKIRGVGKENIYVLKQEFKSLTPTQKRLFT